jgi:hypothetical protein
MVASDARNVFLNLDEFAEIHTVEGREISVVMAPDQMIPAGVSDRAGYMLGVSESSIVLHAKDEDLPERKQAGEALSVDGREYVIDRWDTHMGMTQIFLTQMRTT